MSAKGLLAELETLGAFGETPAPVPSKSHTVRLVPLPAQRDALAQVLTLCDRATTLMETSIRAQMQLVELLAQIRALAAPEAPAAPDVAPPDASGEPPVEESAPESGESLNTSSDGEAQ